MNFHDLQKKLPIAIKSNDLKLTQTLIEKGARPELIENILDVPVEAQQHEIVKLLLKHDAKTHASKNYITTPLHISCFNNDRKIIALLLEHKAQIGRLDDKKIPASAYAVSHGDIKTIEIIAPYLDKLTEYAKTLTLEWSVFSGNSDVVQRVFEQLNPFEMTSRALAYATYLGHLDIVEYLVENGANLARPSSSVEKTYGLKAVMSKAGDFYPDFYLYLALKYRRIPKVQYLGKCDECFNFPLNKNHEMNRGKIFEYLFNKDIINRKRDFQNSESTLDRIYSVALEEHVLEVFIRAQKKGAKLLTKKTRSPYETDLEDYSIYESIEWIERAGKALALENRYLKITEGYYRDTKLLLAALSYANANSIKSVPNLVKKFIFEDMPEGIEKLDEMGLLSKKTLGTYINLAKESSKPKSLALLNYLKDPSSTEKPAVEKNKVTEDSKPKNKSLKSSGTKIESKLKIKAENSINSKSLLICVTGKVYHFAQRKELIEYLEKHGHKFTDTVSPKTNYLVNNDPLSTSKKNKKAIELGIPIISEDKMIEMLGE